MQEYIYFVQEIGACTDREKINQNKNRDEMECFLGRQYNIIKSNYPFSLKRKYIINAYGSQTCWSLMKGENNT